MSSVETTANMLMKNGLSLLGGVGVGVGIMYLLDPEVGRQRRQRLRDKTESALHPKRSEKTGIATQLALTAAGAMAVGAGLMFLFDPQLGRRRRAIAQDKIHRASQQGVDAIKKTGRLVGEPFHKKDFAPAVEEQHEGSVTG